MLESSGGSFHEWLRGSHLCQSLFSWLDYCNDQGISVPDGVKHQCKVSIALAVLNAAPAEGASLASKGCANKKGLSGSMESGVGFQSLWI